MRHKILVVEDDREIAELVARVRALFRRVDNARGGDHSPPLEPIEAFGLVLDPLRLGLDRLAARCSSRVEGLEVFLVASD